MSSEDSALSPTAPAAQRWFTRFGRQRDLTAVFQGAARVFAIRLAGAGLAYVSMIFLARWLGTFEFGIYAYVWVWVITLSGPFALGYCSSALRFIPDYLARGKWRRLNGFLTQSYGIVTAASVSGAFLCAAVLIGLRDMVEPYYFLPILIGLACVPLQTILNQFESVARAFGWVQLAYVPGYIVRPLLLIVAVGGLTWFGMSPDAVQAMWAVLAACIVAASAQAIQLFARIRNRVPDQRSVFHSGHWTQISLSFVMVDVFRMLLESGDVVMIGRLLDPDSVAIYYAAIRTGSLIAFIYFAVVAIAVPKFSEIYATGTRAELQTFVSGVLHLMFWPSLLASLAMVLVGPFVLSLFGPAFEMGFPVLLIVLVGLVLRTSLGPVEFLLNMTGHQRDTLRTYGIAAAANIGLNLLLIPLMGIIGAAVASYMAILGGNVWLYVLVRRRLGIDAFVFSFRRQRAAATASVAAGRDKNRFRKA